MNQKKTLKIRHTHNSMTPLVTIKTILIPTTVWTTKKQQLLVKVWCQNKHNVIVEKK